MTMHTAESDSATTVACELTPVQTAAPALGRAHRVLMQYRSSLGRVWTWAVIAVTSVLQQALFAGSHFIANILLARWLAPASYGAFALSYSFFLLLLLLYMALFYDQIQIYGGGRYSKQFSAYILILVRLHFVLLLPVSILLALAAPLFGRFYGNEVRMTMLAMAAVSPFLLLVWLCRAAFYARLNFRAGAIGGACYFVLLIVPICALRFCGFLSPESALGGMAAASVFVSAGSLLLLSSTKYGERSGGALRLKLAQVAADHWTYGRWAVLASAAAWIPANIYYALLPRRFGLESTATLRALMNLWNPLLHTMMALVFLLIPILVRQRECVGVPKVKQTVRRLVALFLPAGVLYLLLLVTFRTPLLHFLYGERYSDVSAWTVICLGALPITTGVEYLLAAGLRALERPQLVFWSYFAATGVSLVAGVPLTLHYGVAGAACGLIINDLPTIAVLAISLATIEGPHRATA